MLRYNAMGKRGSFRGSVGRGKRAANIFAEMHNYFLLLPDR